MSEVNELFNALYELQEEIPVSPKWRKQIDTSVYAFAGKTDRLRGAHYSKGYVVGTDGFMLIADKTCYDEDFEGLTFSTEGTAIEGRYPQWETLKPQDDAPTILCDFAKLSGQLRTIRAMKTVALKGEKQVKKRVDGSLVIIRFTNSCVAAFKLSMLELFCAAAERLGMQSVIIKEDKDPLFAKSENGQLIIMPHSADLNDPASDLYPVAAIDLKV